MVFFCQIRLTCQSLPCTNFWCWHMPLQLRDKRWFYSRIDHKYSASPGQICSTPVLSSFKPLEPSSRSKP
jgi:hypothetical protein